MKLYLIRHGEPDWELGERLGLPGPRRDLVPLTPDGIAQIQSAARDPRLLRADLIVASPYPRTLQSAHVISRSLDLPVAVEWDLHDWVPDKSFRREDAWVDPVTTWGEIVEMGGRYPPAEERIWESPEEIRRRALSVLSRYCRHDPLIVVTHAGVIYALSGVSAHHADIVEANVAPWAS